MMTFDLATLGLVVGVFGIALAATLFLRGRTEQARLRSELAGLAEQTRQLQQEKQALAEQLPETRVHTMLMDGMPGSGKSTFIARLISPVSTRQDLLQIAATTNEYQTLDAPLCWEKGSNRTTLHTIRFFDVAGERGSTFIDALYKLADAGIRQPEVVLVVVWDLCDENYARNGHYLNDTRLEMAYGSKMAKSIVRSIIVFFNKVDLLAPEVAQARIEESKARLSALFRDKFEVGYGDIHYFAGSAISGLHMHDCFGAIIKRLELEHNFEKATGNALAGNVRALAA
ncbi:MAG TPA: GTPase domain-containing protein [Candidatus Competibacteraceae bacterium]|nr:GTPase domain-containing protein [Candidatus Competibacteraceae bacterium]